ncbi:MAG: M23 family metallopeptidase, partial [Mariprofundaceae bacterium]|nr:M23 family metallopeptidase [Mariprofundaceae bacterium]
VKAGDEVEYNQLIGRVGSTGHSTGPHLHYEVRLFGKTLNPSTYLPRG